MDLNAHQAYLILLGAGVKTVNGYHLSPSIFKEPVAREVTYRGCTIKIVKGDNGGWFAHVLGHSLADVTPAAAQRRAFWFIDTHKG